MTDDEYDLHDPHVSGDLEAEDRMQAKKDAEAIRGIQLEEMAKRLGGIADFLWNEISDPCTNGRKCLEQKGVGYLEYDPRKMCSACELCWFVDCANILLENRVKR